MKKTAASADALSRPKPSPAPVRGRALPDLDRLLHERVRLGIASALAANDSLSFNELKTLLATGTCPSTRASSKRRDTSPARNRSRAGCRGRNTG